MTTRQWHTGGADFDSSGAYRYRLWRVWHDERPRLLWILLNPSTADGRTDDATVRRCIEFTRREQIADRERYGGLEIVNLFAFRTTKPQRLLQLPASVAIGVDNDRRIAQAAADAKEIVVAWGARGVLCDRDCEVLARLANHPTQPLLCLDTVSNGCPWHPLRQAMSVLFMPYASAHTTYPVRRCRT